MNNPKGLFVKKDIKIASLGASHGVRGINPEFFDGLENLSVQGERLMFTSEKLSLVLRSNSNIKRIILTVYPSTFSEARFRNDEEKQDFLSNVFRFKYLYNDEIKQSLSKIKGFDKRYRDKFWLGLYPPTSAEFQGFLKFLFGQKLSEVHPGWGGYRSLKSSHLNKTYVDSEIKRQYYYHGEIIGYSQEQLEYLDEIISICKKNNAQLFLVRTPEHGWFRENIPSFYADFFDNLMVNKVESNEDLYYLDFSKMNIDDKAFYDGGHLNIKGSEIFSKQLNLEIAKYKPSM